jgi:F420-dependent oxidoreductase-like protein
MMNIGVFIGDANGERTTVPTLQAQAQAAEAAGFVTGWVPHIPWSLDGLTALAIAGLVTDRIELGTAVMPTYTRHPLTMAQQALSAQAAASGRVTLGIGPSHPVVIEKMYGLAFDRPIAHMREYIGVLRAAFDGSPKVVFDGELYHTDALLEVPGSSPVPILVAALAPQMLRLTGTVADGTIAYWADERAIGDHVVPLISQAAEAAGRPPPRVVAGLPIAIVADAGGVRDQATRMLNAYTAIPTYQRILARGDAEHPVDVALIGDEAHALGRLRAFAAAGATDLCAAPLGLGPDGEATKRRTLEFLASLTPAL